MPGNTVTCDNHDLLVRCVEREREITELEILMACTGTIFSKKKKKSKGRRPHIPRFHVL